MFPPSNPPGRPRFAPNVLELESRVTPVVVAVDDYYRANAGQVLEIPFNRSVLANDFSSVDSGAVLTATLIGTPQYFDFTAPNSIPLANPVPAGTLTLDPDGTFRLVVPSDFPRNVQALVFTYLASNAQDPFELPAVGTVIIYLGRTVPPRFAVGPEAGGDPVVRVYEVGSGQLVQTIEDVYEPTFTGGVRVAVADFNADGVPDVATAPGTGGGARIKIFDGRTGRVLFDNFVFANFTGGAYVAAGDVNQDGFTDLIVGAGTGGGPRVLVINGQGLVPNEPGGFEPFQVGPRVNPANNIINRFDPLMDFFAYEPSFRGGVRVAAGDVTGVGRDFVITAAGEGGGPVVKTFDFFDVVGPISTQIDLTKISNGISTRQPISSFAINSAGSAAAALSFLAGDPRDRAGINVAAGDVDGDGKAEIITGAASGQAIVSVFNGLNGGLLSQFGVPYVAIPIPLGDTDSALLAGNRPPSGVLIGPTQPPNALVPTGPGIPYGGAPAAQTRFAPGGVTVTTRDWDNDGKAEILAGAGPGNAARVGVFEPDGTQIADVLTFGPDYLIGINVG